MQHKRPVSSYRKPGAIVAVAASCLFALTILAFPRPGQAAGASGGVSPFADLAALNAAGDYIEAAENFDVDIHELYFSLRPYEGTGSCLMCHEDQAAGVLDMGHFKWSGKAGNIVGMEDMQIGKRDLLNNFCVAVPSNEARCTQCHVGLGWADAGFDFNDPLNIDCLACHDQSGSYSKGKTSAGLPEGTVDLGEVARSIKLGAKPTRKACITCHAFAGGGDNVKHGDLSSDLVTTTREYDVHMGTDGANMVCVDCHAANHDPKTGEVNHGMAGMSLHSVHEGEIRQCRDCHGSMENIHVGTTAEDMLTEDRHSRLACQSCHIPAFARKLPTKVEWYWADAGKDLDSPPDPDTGKPTFDQKKGTFNWSLNVRPTLLYSNRMWNRKVIGLSDTYDGVPIDLASPVGSNDDPKAMIYPFKLMVGNQPVDPVNKIVLVPHLYGPAAGPDFFWKTFDWGKALAEGAAYAGQEFSGSYEFAATTMYLSVNHEVAPAENALGVGGIDGGGCLDCHDDNQVDWKALGWTMNPMDGGKRVTQPTRKPDPAGGLTTGPSD